MTKQSSDYKRISHIEKEEIYFYTATINKWQRLLQDDKFKDAIVNSLKHLSDAGKIDVFAFVIMPNHIHLIWRINESKGKETPQASFLKFTAHEFKKILGKENPGKLSLYEVQAKGKLHEFWQRDSLAVLLFTQEVAYQKLDYIHDNPLAEYWRLATNTWEYKYSSASYYEKNENNFPFLKDLRQEF